MPLETASADVPPSQNESVEIEAPNPGVTVTATPSASAIDVAVSPPWFRISSLPAPARIAAAVELAVDVASAADTPIKVVETPTEVLFDEAIASIVAVLVITSFPSVFDSMASSIKEIPAVVTSIDISVATLPLPPSPSIPVASASAVVPPSQTASSDAETPKALTDTLAATATALASAVNAPSLVILSLPPPASIAAASERAVDVLAATEPPMERAAPTDTATASASAWIEPLL